MLNQLRLSNLTTFLCACLLAGFLAACGGGGSGGGCVNIDPTRSGSLPGCGTSTSPGTGNSTSSLTIVMLDGAGNAIADVSPDKPAVIKVTVKNSSGVVQPNTVVSFSSTDGGAVFSPTSATAMTDSAGVASIGLAAGKQAGAFTLSASAAVGTTAVKASKNYTVSFPILTLSDMVLTPSSLPAGANASVSLTVMNGASAYAQPVSVAFSSPCIVNGKASINSPVTTQNGVALASYTDKGCSSSDILTATVVLPNGTLTKSATFTILPNAAGSITFVGVSTTNIALKGTGGAARPDSSTVKFQVLDKTGNPVIGKLVNFTFSDSNTTVTTGGLQLSPAAVISSSDGTVQTTVSGGTIPTSVRVTATVNGSAPLITTVSSLLVVSSGVPDQAHFSLAISIGNCEGWSINQVCGIVSVIVGDHFGNQVPDGTVVNFTAEGGVIEDSCKTVRGTCTVPLYSASPRPANGKVTVLAYAIGEETFVDTNGNNVFDPGEPFTDKSPDIYRDDDENGAWTPGEPCIGVSPNATCNTAGDGAYNGVLRVPQQPSSQILYVSNSLVAQFSTSSANITFNNAPLTCTPGALIDALVTVTDQHGIWMPFGSTITFSTSFPSGATSVTPASATVPNVVLGVGSPLNIPTYALTVTCPTGGSVGKLIVKVTSPSGVETTASTALN
jgi:hypothetical protein